MREVSVIEINLSDLDHNLRVLREMVGPACSICPIVKADAYGFGAARIAKRMVQNGIELLAVYTPEQASELLAAAIGARVLVLMPVREIARGDALHRGLVADRVHLTAHDLEHLNALLVIAERCDVRLPVHLEIDTGMSRGGCSLREADEMVRRIVASDRLELAGLFTHFASSESDAAFTDVQLQQFDHFIGEHELFIPRDCRIHAASSFATLRHRRFHKRMVRVGLAWAGYGAEFLAREMLQEAQRLRPILSWKSRLVHLKRIEPGAPVGYGSAWIARRPSVIGLIPVGYADGYPTGLGGRDRQSSTCSGASVAIAGRDGVVLGYARVVGAVNMDQITVDLTDVITGAAAANQIGLGTPVEVISADPAAPNHLPRLAKIAAAVPHEMLCRLNPRLKRVYLGASANSESASAEAIAG
jgi:alanine racemase